MSEILKIGSGLASPELCQKLVESGAPTETAFMWVRLNYGKWQITQREGWRRGRLHFGRQQEFAPSVQRKVLHERWPAYNVAELGVLLAALTPDGFMPNTYFAATSRTWVAQVGHPDSDQAVRSVEAATEAEARASLALEVLELGELAGRDR